MEEEKSDKLALISRQRGVFFRTNYTERDFEISSSANLSWSSHEILASVYVYIVHKQSVYKVLRLIASLN